MELSWPIKLRIAAVLATGIIVIGVAAWPLAAPNEPYGLVFFGTISLPAVAALIVVAFLVGLISYLISWPWGKEIGILAVPAGLGVWAIRSGNAAGLMQTTASIEQRQAFYNAVKWEPIIWLVIVAAGFAAVLVADRIWGKTAPVETKEKPKPKSSRYLNIVISVIASVLIAQFCIGIFAQDVRMPDKQLRWVVGQPASGQIVFAVLVSFAVSAFVAKKFLNAGYIWPTISSGLVSAYAISAYVKPDVLRYLARQWPAAFFPNAVASVLPLQMVAFGTIGSIIGYWLAVRYGYWRRGEIHQPTQA